MQYGRLVKLYAELEKTSKRLEKTGLVSGFLSSVSEAELPGVILLLQGRLHPYGDGSKSGVAGGIVLKALKAATGVPQPRIEDKWKETGDLGLTARELVSKRRQGTLFAQELSVAKVLKNLQRLSSLEGPGSVERKVGLMAELLTSATPDEAVYIIRTLLEDLRVGVGDGVIRDALVWAYLGKGLKIKYDIGANSLDAENRKDYTKAVEAVQEAYDLTSDFGLISTILKRKGLAGLGELSIEPGRPVKAMLYPKAADIPDAFRIVGRPAAFEYKYDGFRLQLHRDRDRVMLFTRGLENVTEQFPDVVQAVLKLTAQEAFILDSEVAGYDQKTGRYLPFQSISQRIKRKYDIQRLAQAFPVEVNVFDVLSYRGKSTIGMRFCDRRKLLQKIVKEEKRRLVLARQIVTGSEEEAEKFYKEALAKGNEGIMAKSLEAVYKPGSRIGYGVKVKPVMDSLDLVIVGAEWGEGKRANWLTSYTLACRGPNNALLEIGRVSTGVKELETEGTSYKGMTELLKPLLSSEQGRAVKVRPKAVIEVRYEEIQRSPSYSSGYALRFPRFVRLRTDRSRDDIDSIETVEELYRQQRNRNS